MEAIEDERNIYTDGEEEEEVVTNCESGILKLDAR